MKFGCRPSGGTTTPGGTSRIVAARADVLPKSVPTGVTTICTMVPLSTDGPEGDDGAVNTSVARPFASVTRLRADSEPKSDADSPSTKISARSDRLGSGLPFGSRAVIVTSDCDAPSCVSTSGDTVIVIAVPNSDGPVSGGVSWFFVVQPADARHAASAAPMRVRVGMNGRFICKSPFDGALVSILWVVTGSAKSAKVTPMLPVTLTARPVWSCP